MLEVDNMNNGQVDVLMATYNGEKFLDEQLESIFSQSYANFHLFIRDDCSTDGTLNLIKKYQQKHNVTYIHSNHNLGAAASFFELLKISRDESDYFAFSDQDDIWYESKLSNAVKALSKVNRDVPALYFTQKDLVDEHNRFITRPTDPRKIGFGNALVENIATGCTIVMNKAARNLILSSLPERCLMHDAWCYLVISAFGKCIYDPNPSMRYRQHSANTIGAATSKLQHAIKRIQRFKWANDQVFRFSDQAATFLSKFGKQLSPHQATSMIRFVASKNSFWSRLRLSIESTIWRQNFIDNLILRMLILLNRY